jgi:hypothetical protein
LFSHAKPHTYSPDYVDFLNWLSGWLFSSGNVLTDVVLQVLWFLVTVTVVKWYFDRQEELRWLPAKQNLYVQLFITSTGIVDGLTKSARWEEPHPGVFIPKGEWEMIWYRFGQASLNTFSMQDFYSMLTESMNKADFENVAKTYVERPELLEAHQDQLRRALGPWSDVFLGRDPELNRLVNDLDKRLSETAAKFKFYGRGSDTLEQVGVSLHILSHSAYALSSWLANHAERGR